MQGGVPFQTSGAQVMAKHVEMWAACQVTGPGAPEGICWEMQLKPRERGEKGEKAAWGTGECIWTNDRACEHTLSVECKCWELKLHKQALGSRADA